MTVTKITSCDGPGCDAGARDTSQEQEPKTTFLHVEMTLWGFNSVQAGEFCSPRCVRRWVRKVGYPYLLEDCENES